MMITKQREAEAAKNSSIKEMIRRQKEEAEERKAMVSFTESLIDFRNMLSVDMVPVTA